MIFQRVIPSFLCVAALAACASTAQQPKLPTMAAMMSEADAAVMAGKADKAITILKGAGSAYPADKTPWLRIAQMRYDSKDYGDAIVNALAALERDPNDTLASSIVAVSGLRVSSKALAELTQTNNLSGSVRSEAQDLAKLLRSALGEKELVPEQTTRSIAHGKEPPKRTASAQTRPAAASSDPFGALK